MKKYLFFIALILLFLIPGKLQAAEKSWFFDKWDVAYQINKDSTILVQEAQTFNFTGDFSWVTRDLEKNKGIRYTDIKVTEVDGTELTGKEIEITEDDWYVTIKLNFDLSNTSHTWIFEYKIIGGIGFFEDYDEFYWNVVSEDREVRIDEAQATVYLPEPVEVSDIQQKNYVGGFGSTDETYDYTTGTKEMNFFAEDIRAYENFTIVAGWPKGVVEYPGYVYLDSNPSKAQIIIDGKESSQKTPANLLINYDILEGARRVELSKFGYEKYSVTLEVKKGEDKNLRYDLVQTQWYIIGKNALIFFGILYVLSPLFLLVHLFIKWKKHGRDPEGKKTIIPQYEPPDKIRPAEMGVLIDERADLHDITSTIIDLAYRGYIRIYEKEKKHFLSKTKDYTFEKLKDFENDDELKDYEKELLKGLFGLTKTKVRLKDLKNKFYKTLKKIKKSLYQETTSLGYFESNPETVRHKYSITGGILLGAGWILFFIPAIWGLLILIFGMVMPKKTNRGVEAKWYADGFKMYLHTAERFRLGQVTPQTFEKFLPFAMVFKVEEKWAERFKDIYKEPPDWYVGAAGARAFAITSFTSNISSSFAASVSSGLSSTPSSSSGFSGGGGFAGGGGGGGGSGAG